MGDLLLSRTLDPADYPHLVEELRVVGDPPLAGEHPHHHWEYAIALHAVKRWRRAAEDRPVGSAWPVYDVGGGRRAFAPMLKTWIGGPTPLVVDPLPPARCAFPAESLAGLPLATVVTCLSLVERTPDPEALLYHLGCLLAPGGLLVLTMTYWNKCGPDTAAGYQQRARIYCPKLYQQLRQQAQALQLTPFGGVDPTWHGAHLHDHSIASLVLEKRR